MSYIYGFKITTNKIFMNDLGHSEDYVSMPLQYNESILFLTIFASILVFNKNKIK